MVRIASKERIPLRALEDLDHVPSSAREQRFQFLDDLSVTAHRPVESLQIAIDDESQVVEPFARGQGQPSDRLRLIHLAVAKYAPDMRFSLRLQPAVFEIAYGPR